MTERELRIVDRLKANAMPFALCTPEEQEVFKQVGPENCIVLTGIERATGWAKAKWGQATSFFPAHTFRIKKDYQPESEIERCRVWPPNECYTFCHYRRTGEGEQDLAAALPDPDFMGFEYEDGKTRCIPRLLPAKDNEPAQIPVAVLFRRRK